ncbi:1-phosphofructokinase family hexose kinase [Sanguibacter gelidistatuariae]|uniref:1-phosphofructokinase family hexose kinase n=1 Tax=Sanguibacter gelidistatuariae TaxID=1814289 RepID=UPI001FE18F75|nr:PfkB family carbohydrate kinase [Sanguibacter gelidistatuariae]
MEERSSGQPRVCVLAPMPLLTVTIEPAAVAPGPGPTAAASRAPVHPEIHVHAGGQGLWIARMASSLGADVVVCGPFGGESGDVVAHLAHGEHLALRPSAAHGNGTYIHDRREGERREVAVMPPEPLNRHEQDDLYGTVLTEALDADVCVLTGADAATGLPTSFFHRLAADLRTAGCLVVADLSGDQARAVAEVGGAVMKISHTELIEAGYASADTFEAIRAGAQALLAAGARAVVVSRAAEAGLLALPDAHLEVTTPRVRAVDHRGAGDSMTAGIAVALARGSSMHDAVRLGSAAGALNATRRGLGTGRRDAIERLAQHVEVRQIR